MTLILWKGPQVREEEEARALLEPWYRDGDDSAFEPSPDLALVAEELRRLYPDDPDGDHPDDACPWAELPFSQTERLLDLSIRWGTDNAVLDSIEALARKHCLVLYDPQGPDIHLPDDSPEPAESPPPRFVDLLKFALVGLGSFGLVALGWWLPVPVLNWVLILVGGFVGAAFLFVLYLMLFPPRDPKA